MARDQGKDQGPYYFSRGQLTILGAGVAITSLIIFVLGVLVGQRIEERKLAKKEDSLVKIPVRPLPPEASRGASAKEEMTFYDTLSKAPSKARVTPKGGLKELKLAEKAVKPAAREAKGIEAKEKKVSAPQEVKEKAGGEKTPGLEMAKAETPGQRVWTVQINAYRDERPAERLVKKMREKGYDAYMVTATINEKPWYRVRIGRFETRAQARELQETLKTKENFTNAIAVSR